MDRSRILWGLILLALGGVLLAGQLGPVEAGALIATWWPAAIVVAGLLRLFERPPDLRGAAALAVVGVVLLGWRHGLLELTAVIPLALIAAGLWLILGRRRSRAAAVEAGSIDVLAAFGGREVRVASRPFRGGRVAATLGGAEVDLRDAVLPADGAVLRAVAVLGGVEVTLPAGWDVSVTGPAVLGAIEERILPAPEGAPVLTIDATVVLGGIEVVTDPRSQAAGPTGDRTEPREGST